ncbi:MAG: hypothetical protein GX802_05990 [Clostridiales bacterium]|jgi:hypothetical protein|nr:hypothetical protein [Clostridiales bacterium]
MRHRRVVLKLRKHKPTRRIKQKVVKPTVIFKSHKKVANVTLAKPTPNTKMQRKVPKKAMPKVPFRHRHKSEYTFDFGFVGLALLLLALLCGFGFLLYFLLK